mmetsp:Transcript_57670/g.137189  ORF Transcript_57670/g.137189 Transcript_57670/m.137189 type:complete len:347 (-) Transcript_57670:43-1083(-)
MEALQERASKLAEKLEQRRSQHEAALTQLSTEVADLKKRLHTLTESPAAPSEEGDRTVEDSAFVRKVEWCIADIAGLKARTARNVSVWSPEFTLFGIPGIALEFFPTGRESTTTEGFCSLFLWCPPGVHIKYRLRVGSHLGAPDEDEYASKMGHGHSNFCNLDSQINQENDTLQVGLDVMNFSFVDSSVAGIKVTTFSPESLIAREAEILSHRHMDEVRWKIRNVRQHVKQMPKGMAISSKAFSLAGVREIFLEFYPNGTAKARDGYCGLHVRCPGGTNLILTLFVGSATKGPVQTLFDGKATKGLPEFCALEEQINADGDVVVGMRVRSTQLEQESEQRTLEILS